jgi:hypothetical protein
MDNNQPAKRGRKSFISQASAAMEQPESSDKIFGGISEAGVAGDPMGALLDKTSNFTIAAAPATPNHKSEPAPEKKPVTDTSVGDGEDTGISPEFIHKQNDKLKSAGKNNISDVLYENPADAGDDGEYAESVSDDTPPPLDGDRIAKRRQLVGRFSGKFIDRFITSASVMAHEVFVSPKAAIKEHSELMARLGSLSPNETARLQVLDLKVKDYTAMKSDYAVKARMDKDELDELQACIADIMETEDVNIHPGWMIGIILVSTFVVNAVGIWFDRMAIRSRWN